MTKVKIRDIGSVGIIYRKSDPRQIFLEMKDEEHPLALGRNQLCLLGGSWTGQEARADINPLDTFRREIIEELSFPQAVANISQDDEERLATFRVLTCINCIPFGTFANTITKKAMDSADSNNKQSTFTILVCYYIVPFEEEYWKAIEKLQTKFGNLSNESLTVITSLEKIIEQNQRIAFGHDHALQRFWLDMGYPEAKQLPLVKGVHQIAKGLILPSYQEYLEQYEIAVMP